MLRLASPTPPTGMTRSNYIWEPANTANIRGSGRATVYAYKKNRMRSRIYCRVQCSAPAIQHGSGIPKKKDFPFFIGSICEQSTMCRTWSIAIHITCNTVFIFDISLMSTIITTNQYENSLHKPTGVSQGAIDSSVYQLLTNLYQSRWLIMYAIRSWLTMLCTFSTWSTFPTMLTSSRGPCSVHFHHWILIFFVDKIGWRHAGDGHYPCPSRCQRRYDGLVWVMFWKNA